MLPLEDRRRTTAYEVAYGWYTPGNAWDALIALAIFVETDQQRDYALGLLKSWIDPIGAKVSTTFNSGLNSPATNRK